ncbi:MAG: sigma-70 family RNA polymerase sigma factor [Gemmatimonadota bacterium]
MDETWVAPLKAGDHDTAWDAFLDCHRRLIFAAIRHYATDHDDIMDIFARTCELLREDELRRIRAFVAQQVQRAKVSTWLVTVVRHITVDWYRARDGRHRPPAFVSAMTPQQRAIHQHVFVLGHSHIACYEALRAAATPPMTFSSFQVALREVYALVAQRGRGAHRHGGLDAELAPESDSGAEPSELMERGVVLEQALASLAPEARLVVELFVIEELPAREVARIAGLPNAKVVYNTAYRALTALRAWLQAHGYSQELL